MAWCRAACLSTSSQYKASEVRARRDLLEKWSSIYSPWAFLLLCPGEGEAEGLRRWMGVCVGWSSRLPELSSTRKGGWSESESDPG